MKAGPATSRPAPPATASRRRVLARTRLDFRLDAALLVAYTLAYSLGFTGIAVHEWPGIGLGAALLLAAGARHHRDADADPGAGLGLVRAHASGGGPALRQPPRTRSWPGSGR